MQVLRALKTFIRAHPVLHPDAGDIFTPQENTEIRFFFNGGATVTGSSPTLEINFNDPDLLILATGSSVFRFKRSALLGFELVLHDLHTLPTPGMKGLRLVSSKP